MTYPRRTAGAVLAGLLLGLCGVLLAPASPASAHAVLLRTVPTAGTVVTTLPAEFVMVFSEPVRLVPGKVHALAPDGKVADTGVTTRGDEVHIALRPG